MRYVAVSVALEDKAETRPNFVGSVYSCCLNTPFTVPEQHQPNRTVEEVVETR